MNLVEIYLKEIYNIIDYVPEWANEFPDRKFVLVKAKWNCYGHEYIKEDLFNVDEWEIIKEKGYYLG